MGIPNSRGAPTAVTALASLMKMFVVVVALVAPAVCLRAQPATSASATRVQRTVDGRVRRPLAVGGDSTGMGAAVGAWVTVHRVAKDSAGPLDSVRTDAAGRYHLAWRAFGSSDAVYFASVTWDGIAYFTAPLRATNARDDDAEITVFDTTSRTFPLSVRGRHLIIGKTDSTDARTIIEVFELSNDSLHTLVSSDGTSPAPTWSVAIPQAARDVRSSEGEISPDAFAFSAGRVSVFAPLAPGLKQVSFSYKLPSNSFPMTFAAERGVSVFEVLIEDPLGTVAATGFANVDPVTLERRTFRRYIGQDVPSGVRILVNLPVSHASTRSLYIAALLVVIGVAMLLVLARSLQRRRAGSAATRADGPAAFSTSGFAAAGLTTSAFARSRAPVASLSDRLAQEISALDARHSLEANATSEAQAEYERRRAQLRTALAKALAAPVATP